MNLKTHTVYPEIQEKSGFSIGRLYDAKGTQKFKTISESKTEVIKTLETEAKKYERK